MPTAADIYGTAFKGGTLTALARIVGADGSVITQGDISSIAYTIYLLDEQDADTRTAVTDHTAEALTVANVVYDTLQTDSIWTKDSTGYNFAHTVDISPNAAFAVAGRRYQIEYTLTPASGEPIIVRFQIDVI